MLPFRRHDFLGRLELSKYSVLGVIMLVNTEHDWPTRSPGISPLSAMWVMTLQY